MAYGDGGYYFLQPVSQPAGAYGAFAPSLLRGPATKAQIAQSKYLSRKNIKARSLEDLENEVAKSLAKLNRLKATRARVRKALKQLRRQLRTGDYGAIPGNLAAKIQSARGMRTVAAAAAARQNLKRQIRQRVAFLKKLNVLIQKALKEYQLDKKRLAKKRSAMGLNSAQPLGPAPMDPQVIEDLQGAVLEKEIAETELEQEAAMDAEEDVEPGPEDLPMADEEDVMEIDMAGPSFFEENKNVIYLAGAGLGAFFLYKALK